MRSAEEQIREVTASIEEALTEALGMTEFDILRDDQGVTVAGDEWSLRLESEPALMAWLAIDSEPDNPSEFRKAILTAFTELGLDALGVANRGCDGQIAHLLDSSGDPISVVLADMLGDSVDMQPQGE